MSAIPPNWLASAIQAHDAQRRTGEAKTREESDAAGRTDAAAAAEKRHTIENEDADSSVYADAEGAGGQGRSFSEAPEHEGEDGERADDDGDQSAGGLDIEA